MAYKVRLASQSALQLIAPLSDGTSNFVSGIDYTVPTFQDFLRLVQDGIFNIVEMDDDVVNPFMFCEDWAKRLGRDLPEFVSKTTQATLRSTPSAEARKVSETETNKTPEASVPKKPTAEGEDN